MVFGPVRAVQEEANLHAAGKPRLRLVPIAPEDPLRGSVEQFIAARFARVHGAQVSHFLPELLGVHDEPLLWRAAAGYAPASAGRLFLEQYLDAPVEEALSAASGRPVGRDQVVEVGNFTAQSGGMARALIPLLARHLHRRGYRWVTFTATSGVRNSFRRLGLQPLELARADAGRVNDGGASWGRYYEHDPRVMGGRISQALRGARP